MSQKRNIDMKMPLSCVPLSLAEADGSLRKTGKSDLLHKIEGNVEARRSIPKDCAYIMTRWQCYVNYQLQDLHTENLPINTLKQY